MSRAIRCVTLWIAIITLLGNVVPVTAALKPTGPREHVSLNGPWEIAQGGMQNPPNSFSRSVPVPGLIDMAKPPFKDVGKQSPLRQAFWYRRTFTLDRDVPEVAILKLHKAKYGSKVWLNGQVVAEHFPCFTPGYFDVRTLVRGNGERNELIIRVGADRESLPQDMPTGWDFEKYLYIPGIYDSVELILTGKPYIRNVQVVPDIDAQQVRIVAEIDGGDASALVSAEVSTVHNLSVVGRAQAPLGSEKGKVELVVPIPNCRLWSPEDPFLYQLKIDTGKDAATVRFGMRSFGFDPQTKQALLNGKPYYLRGSNITLYRFFEDAQRGDLPWREDWIRTLHQRCKQMHWNSLRYCIGFPPEFWYDIADEEGILIQDEFPIWLLNRDRDKCPENPVASKIIPEYTDWMHERWNHPCVVIWDAQNESRTPETGKAIQTVRPLDLSNRPWENGWAEPQALTDCVESHPYFFSRDWFGGEPFQMSEFAKHDGLPALQVAQRKKDVPIIINEYAWLWLTRDGNPTCLTEKAYRNQLGPESTASQRREVYARYLAAMTEFWRAKRRCAGVLHFCTLGYSRPGDVPRPEGGATSDHWADVEKLEWEPMFQRYVRDAFAPVGIMLDLWADTLPVGSSQSVRVFVTNDLNAPWQGTVHLKFRDTTDVLAQRKVDVAPLGSEILTFEIPLPNMAGRYTLVAELQTSEGESVESLRDFDVDSWTDIMPPADLTGWYRVPVPPGGKLGRAQWHVDAAKNLLICDGDGGHDMLLTEKEYGDCVFRFECRYMKIAGKTGYNSGAYVRNSRNGKIWHQAQFGDADGGFLFGVTTTTGGQTKFFKVGDEAVKNRVKPAGEWNTMEITAGGQTISLRVNGSVTSEFDDCSVMQGHLGLEGEGYRIEFRNLRVKELQ